MFVEGYFQVDEKIYNDPGTEHTVLMATIEHSCRGETLAYLHIGTVLDVRLNGMIHREFTADTDLEIDQFFIRKGQREAKKLTRGAFEETLKRFDVSQTVTGQEIVEEYAYTDKRGRPDRMRIIITIKYNIWTTTLDFKDEAHYDDFVCPAWLQKPR